MPGSGAEAECLKPGWPRRSPRVPPPPPAPRHGKADLLSYHCSSAAPASPARPPPGAAARAADTMRGGGQTRTRDPPGVPGTGGGPHPPAKGLRILWIAPHSLVQRHLAGQRADTRRRGMRGHGIQRFSRASPGTGCCGLRRAVMGKRCFKGVHIPWGGWSSSCWQRCWSRQTPPCCSAAPHASLPHTLGS